MISFDDYSPSDPSSSSHNHQQKQDQISHDLKISDTDLKFLDVDLDDINNNQLPKFSIRDYVFGLRSKDIASNWPFSSTSLQLCLKYGVKNLLPPFESLASLRNNSSLTKCSLENRLTDEKLMNSLDGKHTNDQFKPKSLTTNSSSIKGQQRSKEKPSPSSQKPEHASCHIKKSKFVMKLKLGIEPQRVEDHITTPNNFIVSETMASKVCPVCKTFSSSSNTTLNAHIDQCLTGEGTMKWTDHHTSSTPKVVVKHKVKPRKMRLMLDIYKTAPYCTIEELDRRNGTSWANNSSFPAQEFQFQEEEEDNSDPNEEKKDQITTKNNHTIADNEGDVYIDTNGTKVRILSVPKIGSSDNNGARKLVKGSKCIVGKNKNNIFKQKHQQKYLKVGPNAKKLSPPKLKVRHDQEEDVVMADNGNKNEHVKDPTKVNDSAIVRPPWACSKRTLFSKKFISKNRKVNIPTKDLVIESDKSSKNRKKMETSALVKQPLIKSSKMVFRKEGTPMHHDDDDDDDSQDACPSQHSDDVDTRSKSKKFSSLTKNLSFPATKFNMKRKFSSVEKSWTESVDGSSQDPLKEQSRTQETAVSKKNQDSRSISSKSFSNEESSAEIQTDESNDVESTRNDTLLPISTIPTLSFIGLSASFDQEFSKQDHCIELYQDPICSTNRAPNDVEKHESYFQEVDPIPIPGPPGSFLPASPGGERVFEEQVQETTRVLSSDQNQHHHDTMDQDSMSNSPVSTVSNSRSTSIQDDTIKKSFFNNDNFKNDQPCCCSRKEVALNYQDSYILRKQQPIESNRSTPISDFNYKCDQLFSLSKNPNSQQPETASFPTNKNFPVLGDCDSSPSKPVLRLMGKNLTVVKSNEDEFRPPQSSQQYPQPPVIFNQYQNGFESQHMRRMHVDSRPVYDGFMAPLDRYGHGGAYMGAVRPHQGHNVLDFQTLSGRNVHNNVASSSYTPNKEIIIIDDHSLENEDDDSMRRNEFLRRNQGQMNPLYTMYPSQIPSHSYSGGGGGSGGATVFRGGGFQTSMANGDLGKWNMLSSSKSSSMSNLQPSTIYYPPSYP